MYILHKRLNKTTKSCAAGLYQKAGGAANRAQPNHFIIFIFIYNLLYHTIYIFSNTITNFFENKGKKFAFFAENTGFSAKDGGRAHIFRQTPDFNDLFTIP